MNETIKAILERRSIRKYKDTPVPKEDLDKLVECGMYAATARGIQPWHFTVITDRALLDKISAANKEFLLKLPESPMTEKAKRPDFDNFHNAPAAIIVSGIADEGSEEYTIADCANAAENICLAAHAMGLGTCYIASFRMCMSLREGDWMYAALQLPDGYKPYYAVSVGYPDEVPGERAPRREGMVTYIG